MNVEPSPWRTSDALRFDSAREAVNTVTATLFELADLGAIKQSRAVTEARAIRRELLGIDGFDREAIDGFIERLTGRIADLGAVER